MDYSHSWSSCRFRCLCVFKVLLTLKFLASNTKLKSPNFKLRPPFLTTQIGTWISLVRPKTLQRSVVLKRSMSKQTTHSLLQNNSKSLNLAISNWMVYFHHLGRLVPNEWKNKPVIVTKENHTRSRHLNTSYQIIIHPICLTSVSSNNNRHFSAVNLKTTSPNRTWKTSTTQSNSIVIKWLSKDLQVSWQIRLQTTYKELMSRR